MARSNLTLTEIQKKLTDKSLGFISRRINVSYPTLQRLRDGDDHNFTMNTLTKVSDYLRGDNG